MKWKKLFKTENLIVLALCWAVFFKIFKFGSIPAGFNQDELGSVYDAWSLLHYGVDKWRIPWPIYFLNYGDGQSALHTYLLIPVMAAFGISQAVIRTPALCASFLLLGSGIGILHECWDDRWNLGSRKMAILLFILLYGIAPYTQLSSRLGMDCLLMLGFSTFSIFVSLWTVRKRHLWQFVLAGTVWGVTLYSYILTYVIVPVFLLLTLICLQRTAPLQIRQIIALAVPLGILAFPLVLEQVVNVFQLEPVRLGPFTVTRLDTYRVSELTLSNIPQNFLLTLKSMLMYDWLDYNTIPRYWTFFPVSVPFFFAGIVQHVRILMRRPQKNREWNPSFPVFLWFVLMLMLGCMLGEHDDSYVNPNTNKINGIFFAAMFYIVMGICSVFRHASSAPWKKWMAVTVAVAYGCFFAHFVHYYLHFFQPENNWCHVYPKSFEIISESPVLSKKLVLTSERYYPSHVLSTLPSPLKYDFKKRLDESQYFSWRDGNWIFQLPYLSIDEYVRKYGKNASYLLLEVSDWACEYFQSEGFREYHEGRMTLFYSLE